MGFVCSGYAKFEWVSQRRVLPSSWHSGTLPDPLGPRARLRVQLGAGCRSTARCADVCFPPTAPQVAGPQYPLLPCPMGPARCWEESWEHFQLPPRVRGIVCGWWRGAPDVAVPSAADPLLGIFISPLLVVYLLQYLWGWAPEQGNTIWERLSSLQPKSCRTCCSFVSHRPLLNPLPALLTRELQLLPAAFGKAGGPPLLLASSREDGPCQAAFTVWLQDSQTQCLLHTSFIKISFYWGGGGYDTGVLHFQKCLHGMLQTVCATVIY